MARFQNQDSNSGKLIVETLPPGFNEVYFIPHPQKIAEAGLDDSNLEKVRKHLLTLDSKNDCIHIYPLNTHPYRFLNHFLEPKYNVVKQITLENFQLGSAENQNEVMTLLENLPPGFVKDYDYGLGLLKNYRFLIDALEERGVEHLVINKNGQKTNINTEKNLCAISYEHFDIIRRLINKIHRDFQFAACQIKEVMAINVLEYFLNNEQETGEIVLADNSPLNKWFPDASDYLPVTPSKSKKKQALTTVIENKKAIAKEHPEALVKLRNDIELVTLEDLIKRIEKNIGKKLKEKYWQQLFSENPFILSMAFGFPMIKVQDQAYVGGKKFSGKGGKITDFLVKNGLTNNIGLFEIKKPSSLLLNKRPYRDEVYIPSSELSGAVAQVLDQKNKLVSNIPTIKHNSRIHDIETSFVRAVLVIGKTPEDATQKRSFETFRSNSKEVTIITFDELLENLKQLCKFLQPDEKKENQSKTNDTSN